MLMDGGIRRGSDVLKALALGADAVLLGRLYVYGLAVGGAGGVEAVIRQLAAELDLTLALAGGRSVRELDRSGGDVKLYREESGRGPPAAAADRARLRDLVVAAAAPGLVAAVPLHRGREPGHRPLAEAARAVLDRGAGRRRRRGARRPPRPRRRLLDGRLPRADARAPAPAARRAARAHLHRHRRAGLRPASRRDRRRLGGERRPDAAGVRPRDDAALLPPRLDGRASGRVRAAARRPARAPDPAGVLARAVRRVQRVGRAG